MRLRLNGWQRLWALIGVLYAVLVGGVSYSNFPHFESVNKCGRDSDKAPEEFLRELHGFVRMNFAELWERYSKAIGKVTRNRPEEYLVP